MAGPPASAAKPHFEQVWGGARPWKSRLILIHPIGVVLYVLITLLCAVVAAHGLPPARRLAPLLLAMGLSQSTVGIANEIADRRLDAINKPWRPIAAGHIGVRAAVILGVACAALAGLVAATLSVPAAVLLLCGTGMGVLYSAWLKRTPLSWLPYVVTYPGFALWVWLALGKLGGAFGSSHLLPADGATAGSLAMGGYDAHSLAATGPGSLLLRLLAVYPVMIPLALAAHFCNQLRDYEEDQAQGVRGLMQALGKPAALAVCFGLLLLAPLPMLLYPLPPRPGAIWLMGAAAALHWLICSLGMRRYARHREADDMRHLFRLLQLSGPLLSLSWLGLQFW